VQLGHAAEGTFLLRCPDLEERERARPRWLRASPTSTRATRVPFARSIIGTRIN
jgi:hypothetical protein